jgi:hypothetical protein
MGMPMIVTVTARMYSLYKPRSHRDARVVRWKLSRRGVRVPRLSTICRVAAALGTTAAV